MSNTDSFIDEVSEAVRREKLGALARRWGWLAGLIVIGIVGFVAWSEYSRSRSDAAAQSAGEALFAALSVEDAAARAAALEATGATDPVTRLLAAGQDVLAEDTAAAIATLDALANDRTQPQLYRDLAALRSLILQTGITPPADRILALEALAAPGATFAPLAREQIALAQIEAGDTEAARATLDTIIADAATPQGLRTRAEALIPALDMPVAAEPAEDAGAPVPDETDPAPDATVAED